MYSTCVCANMVARTPRRSQEVVRRARRHRLFSGFWTGGPGGCGVLVMTRNGLQGPKMAKIQRILRDAYTKSYVQNRLLALVVVYNIAHEDSSECLDEIWAVGWAGTGD